MKTEDKYPECQCSKCKEMCKRVPCKPTLREAQNLIDAGFGKRLMVTDSYGYELLMPAKVGYENKGTGFASGQCTFFKEGKCELHNLGLKPLEGKVAIHNQKNEGNWVYALLARVWKSKKGVAMVAEWRKQ